MAGFDSNHLFITEVINFYHSAVGISSYTSLLAWQLLERSILSPARSRRSWLSTSKVNQSTLLDFPSPLRKWLPNLSSLAGRSYAGTEVFQYFPFPTQFPRSLSQSPWQSPLSPFASPDLCLPAALALQRLKLNSAQFGRRLKLLCQKASTNLLCSRHC